jgi:hypothetical protein
MVGIRLLRRPGVRLFGLAWFISLAFNVGAIHDCALAHLHQPVSEATETGHHDHAAGHHQQSTDSERPAHQICDCLGECCASAVASITTGSTTVVAVEAIATPPRLPSGDKALLPDAPEHLHPPSTAPPVAIHG